ncbi:unnamed protein product [Cladocopium goreaui]|uniref:Uncharacterized protein n=1 Tax=Cladocopium goreaui TaxID=2562237 RepID=A0A9P1DCB9_9DINO|nr:unnamed protein product [Cladocopium goreaui]
MLRDSLDWWKYGRYLSEAEASSIFDAGKHFLQLYLKNTKLSLRNNLQEWTMRPKFHGLYHLIHFTRSRRVNCRFHHGFVDEDSMSWLKRTYLKAHPSHRYSWIMKCGRLRIISTRLKIKKFNAVAKRRLRHNRA